MNDPARRRPKGLFGRILHIVFEASLVLKAAFAALEIATGLAFGLVTTQSILSLAERLTVSTLTADPDDRLAGALLHYAQGLSMDVKAFVAMYLALHGAIKLLLVLTLMRGFRWAYPLSIVAFAGFVAYQMHRYSTTGSPALLLLSLFDLLLIGLIAREWRQAALQSRLAGASRGSMRRAASETTIASKKPTPLAARSNASR